LKPLSLIILTSSLSRYSYQKNEKAQLWNIITKGRTPSHQRNKVSIAFPFVYPSILMEVSLNFSFARSFIRRFAPRDLWLLWSGSLLMNAGHDPPPTPDEREGLDAKTDKLSVAGW